MHLLVSFMYYITIAYLYLLPFTPKRSRSYYESRESDCGLGFVDGGSGGLEGRTSKIFFLEDFEGLITASD